MSWMVMRFMKVELPPTQVFPVRRYNPPPQRCWNETPVLSPAPLGCMLQKRCPLVSDLVEAKLLG